MLTVGKRQSLKRNISGKMNHCTSRVPVGQHVKGLQIPTDTVELVCLVGYTKWLSTRAKINVSVRAFIVKETVSPTSHT
jgi:cytochrome c